MKELLPDSLFMNLGFFALSSVGVWFTAWKLTNYIDVIANRKNLGKAFAGIFFLAVATSLPEMATTATAGMSGAVDLAVSNLLGGIALQVVVLTIVDAFALKGKALTSRSPNSALIMQGVILVLTISMAVAAISAREIYTFWNIGLWSVILFITYLFGLFAIHKYEGNPKWRPIDSNVDEEGKEKVKEEQGKKYGHLSTKSLSIRFTLMALGVLTFGYLLTKSAEKVAEQTGLTGGVIGATLLATATSLPEITTTWTAVRLGAHAMAIGNILGSNSLMIGLFLFADVFYREGAIVTEAKQNSIFLGALGIMVTCVYIWGILERRDKTILGMGMDSVFILLLYVGGLFVYSRM